MPEIEIEIKDKHPYLIGSVTHIVADNSDYTIRFTFDEQWEDGPKTVYFVRSNGYAFAPVQTVGDAVSVPVQSDVGIISRLYVGVQQANVKTSQACNIALLPAITDNIKDDAVQPEPDMWEDLMRRFLETEFLRDEAKAAQAEAEAARDGADASAKNAAIFEKSAAGSAGIARESANRAEAAQSEAESSRDSAALSEKNAADSEENAASSASSAAKSADRAEQVAVANGFADFYMKNGRIYLVRTENIVDKVDFELKDGRMVVKISG